MGALNISQLKVTCSRWVKVYTKSHKQDHALQLLEAR